MSINVLLCKDIFLCIWKAGFFLYTATGVKIQYKN